MINNCLPAPALRNQRCEIIGCAGIGILGILAIDAFILRSGIYYYSDDIYILYPVAIHRLMVTPWFVVRPLQYMIILFSNYLYLPLWLGASLLCAVGATILSGLACERLFGRQLPKTSWWVLGLANPLLFYLVSQPDIVSQALCNLLFAGSFLAFTSEFHRLQKQMPYSLHADFVAVSLNLMAAALFFSKETGIAAAIVIPAAVALLRFKARQLSPISVSSLLLPIAAACVWIWLRFKFLSLFLPDKEGARYTLQLSPIAWAKDFILTLAFPVTPLPSSFIGFELLRPLWIGVSLASVVAFITLLLHEIRRQPKILFPLLVVVASCAPMILVRTDELYPSMIAPLAVSIVLLSGASRVGWPSLAYALLLYAASLGNAIVYYMGANFQLFGLQHLDYSIYGKTYQIDPICQIGTTAHVVWDGHATVHLPYEPGVKGRIICIP